MKISIKKQRNGLHELKITRSGTRDRRYRDMTHEEIRGFMEDARAWCTAAVSATKASDVGSEDTARSDA